MMHVLVVAAVLAGFGLTALCAAVFRVSEFWALVALAAGFAFGVPAAISLITDPAPGVPWSLIAISLGVSASVVAALLLARFATRAGPLHRLRPFGALRTQPGSDRPAMISALARRDRCSSRAGRARR